MPTRRSLRSHIPPYVVTRCSLKIECNETVRRGAALVGGLFNPRLVPPKGHARPGAVAPRSRPADPVKFRLVAFAPEYRTFPGARGRMRVEFSSLEGDCESLLAGHEAEPSSSVSRWSMQPLSNVRRRRTANRLCSRNTALRPSGVPGPRAGLQTGRSRRSRQDASRGAFVDDASVDMAPHFPVSQQVLAKISHEVLTCSR
jgi:hypothetical protein